MRPSRYKNYSSQVGLGFPSPEEVSPLSKHSDSANGYGDQLCPEALLAEKGEAGGISRTGMSLVPADVRALTAAGN